MQICFGGSFSWSLSSGPVKLEGQGTIAPKILAGRLLFKNKTDIFFPQIFLMKGSKNFIFLTVLYLIICFMKAPNNFGKIAFLKIWELVSLGGVKTHFGKQWCIFRHEKKIILGGSFWQIPLLIQFRIKHTKHLSNDCLNLSFVKEFYVASQRMVRNGCKMAIYEL